MKDFLDLAKNIYPYRFKALLNILFNILSNIFALGVFGLLIPFLGLLFDNAKHGFNRTFA